MTIIRIVWTFINVSYCVHESWFTLNKNNGLRIKTKLLTCDDIYSCCLYDNLSCKLFVLSLLCGKNVVPHIWMSHVSHMNESCLTYVSHMNYSCCPFCVERMLSLWYMNESCLTYKWVMSHICLTYELFVLSLLCATVVPFVCRYSRLFWVYTPISVGADAYRCIIRYQHPKEPSNRAKEPYNKWKEPDNACVILSIDVLSGSFHLL